MGTNIKEFNKNLKAFANTLVPQQVVVAQKKIALELFTRIIVKTPVDTGRARGNWQITIGAPATGVIETKGSSKGPFSSPPPIGPGAGQGALTKGSKKVESVKGFVTIYITNNVDYIVYLEQGGDVGSDQAPNGMVAVSIEEVNAGLFI